MRSPATDSAADLRSCARRRDVLRLTLVVLVLVVLGRLVTSEFISWDDSQTVAQNPQMNPPTLGAVGHYWQEWRSGEYGLYVPLTYTIWSGLASVSRIHLADGSTAPNPWIFHSANLAIHILSVLGVFELLRRLVPEQWPAFAGAAIFAVHPVQVETVAWVSGMKDLLAGMFSIVAIWQYIAAAQSRAVASRRIRYGIAILAMALGMLSKPSAVAVAPICFVIDLLLLRRGVRIAMQWSAPLLVLAAPALVIGRMVHGLPPVSPPIHRRPMIALDAISFYLGKLIWPVDLGIDYGRTPAMAMASRMIYFAWVAPLLIALLAWWSRSRRVWTSILIFVLAILPVLGLAPFLFQLYSTVADHYLYLAMTGPALLIASALARWKWRTLNIATGVIIVLLGWRAFVQAGYWHDDFVLFPHSIVVNPLGAGLHDNLGAAFYADKRYPEAEAQFQIALKLDPKLIPAKENLALVHIAMGRNDDAERELRSYLAEPGIDRMKRAQDLFRLGGLLLDEHRAPEAIGYLEQAEKIKPDPRVGALIKRARREATMPATAASQISSH